MSRINHWKMNNECTAFDNVNENCLMIIGIRNQFFSRNYEIYSSYMFICGAVSRSRYTVYWFNAVM